MEKYIDLLKSLISTHSFSKEEEKAAEIMRAFLSNEQIPFKTKQNNTWAFCKYFDRKNLNQKITIRKTDKNFFINLFLIGDILSTNLEILDFAKHFFNVFRAFS